MQDSKRRISGGIFATEIPDEYCEDGFIPVLGIDGNYTVSLFSTEIQLNQTSVTMTVQNTITLNLLLSSEYIVVDGLTWSSSNTTVATVDDGKVSAVGYGTAIITAKLGNLFATCTVNVICDENACIFYDDVNEDAWYHPAVDFVTEQKIMQGIGDDQFAPETELTRAQFAQILYNMEGKPEYETDKTFTDVQKTANGEPVWYYDAVMWAASADIVKGHENGSFQPDTSITQQEMVTMLYRYAAFKKVLTGEITEDLKD